MDLWTYEDKHVIIIDIDGQIFTGIVDHYTSALDDPEGIESISLDPDDRADILINITKNEIASIEIITSDTSVSQQSSTIQRVAM